MKHNAYSIYDSKAVAYLPPFMCHSEGIAIRSFTEACNSEGHQFGKFPADYTLFHIGEFDDETGKLVSVNPEVIRNGLNVVIDEEQRTENSSDDQEEKERSIESLKLAAGDH